MLDRILHIPVQSLGTDFMAERLSRISCVSVPKDGKYSLTLAEVSCSTIDFLNLSRLLSERKLKSNQPSLLLHTQFIISELQKHDAQLHQLSRMRMQHLEILVPKKEPEQNLNVFQVRICCKLCDNDMYTTSFHNLPPSLSG